MKRAHVIMGAGLAVFGCILYVNAYSELAAVDAVGDSGIRILPSTGVKVDDINVKSVGGKFNYKEPASNDAQQAILVTAECDLSTMNVSNLNQLSYFSFASGRPGKAVDVADGFFIKPSGVIKGTKLKQKFFPWDKSGGSIEKYAFGSIKGSLKDGKFTFSYAIKKAREGGKLQQLDDYDFVRTTMQNGPAIKSNITLATSITFTPVSGVAKTFNDTSDVNYNAKKTSASAKLVKPPAAK